MQKRAGLLFLSGKTKRVLLILEDTKWTVPTFARENDLLSDADSTIKEYSSQVAKIIPIELYLSEDRGFEYGTYICLVKEEFLTNTVSTICWANLENLPKHLHSGLKVTLSSPIIKGKIDTVLDLMPLNAS
jgi:hypothetical protein